MMTEHSSFCSHQTFVNASNAKRRKGLGVRFASYAKRVRTLILDMNNRHWNPSESHVQLQVHHTILSVWCGLRHLFPHLRELSVREGFLSTPGCSLVLSRWLDSANLTALKMDVNYEVDGLLSHFRANMLAASARLERLELKDSTFIFQPREWDDPGNDEDRSELLADMLCHSTPNCLRVLKTSVSFTVAELSRMSTACTHLEVLSVARVFDLPKDAMPKLPPNAFPRLQSLEIHEMAPDARVACFLLTNWTNTCLTKCSLGFELGYLNEDMNKHYGLDGSAPPQIHAALQSLGTHKSLTHVKIDIPFSCPNTETSGVRDAFLAALSSLPNISEFTLGYNSSLGASDDIIVSIVEACPRLHTIRPEYPDRDSSNCALSLPRLLDILRNRPHIRSLPIFIRGADVPSPEDRVNFGRHFYGPELYISKTANTPAMLDVLREVFPDATIVQSRRD
jgi:hypothetical protein